MTVHVSGGKGTLPQGAELLASTARTADTTSDEFHPLGAQGLIVVIDMSVDPGVDTVAFSVQGKDPVSGQWYTILTSAALTAVAVTVLQIHPALTVVANLAASALVPEKVRVFADHSAATTTTYSVGVIATP